jgi:intraflagellar transport protein 74
VQNLEGELADYNLAGDKYRSNMRAEDIDAVFFHIKSNNKKKRDRSDEMFLEKARKEEELQSVEFEINQIMQKLEQRLMDLEPDQQIEYEQIREENSHLVKKIHELRDEMTRLNVDIVEGEKFLKNNPNKKEAHKLNDQIIQLNRKKELLQLQLNDSGLSLEEWKEKLVKQYKQDMEEKAQVDKKIGEIKKVIDSYKKSITELEKEFENNTNVSVENSKAQDSIMQKDREYSKFIENFDEIKRGVSLNRLT